MDGAEAEAFSAAASDSLWEGGAPEPVEVDGKNYLLVAQVLNPESPLGKGYQVVVFPLDSLIAAVARLRATVGGVGVAGVADDGALLDFHASEVAVRETITEASATSILVLDHTKFGRLAPAVGGNIADIDLVVSDDMPDPQYRPALEPLGDRFRLSEGAS